MKKISCGIIITDKKYITLGHCTGSNYWDIPKGAPEKNEPYIDAAIRETYEETNIQVNRKNLFDLGLQNYNRDKDLYLYLYICDIMPNEKNMYCSSMVVLPNKPTFPEIDQHKNILWDEIGWYVRPNLFKCLSHIYKQYLIE